VSGEVLEVNTALKDKPEDVNTKPHDTWMIKVRLANAAETGDLMDAAAYESHIRE
jgi:glycine cleavage system H protein